MSVNQFEIESKKVIKKLEENLMKLNVSGAHPNLISHINIDYHGDMMPISSISTIRATDATQLVVSPFEQDKKITRAITEAINKANVGLSPIDEGTIVRISVPPVDGEKRARFVKEAKEIAEQAKIAIRTIRQDIIKKIKSNEEFTDDMKKNKENEVQKAVDAINKVIEDHFSQKEKELLKV